MTTEAHTVKARLSAAAPQTDVLVPLALVMGARAGLSVEQIDDLAMAIELLVRHRPQADRHAVFAVDQGRIEVSLTGIDAEWLERSGQMLGVLVSAVTTGPTGVSLRVDA